MVNVADLGKSSLVRMALPLAAPEIKKGTDRLQKVCGIDLWTTVESIVWASNTELDDGVVFVTVKGIDQAKINACAESVAKDDGQKNPAVTATVTGAITELSTGSSKFYMMWVGKDVIAVPMKFEDKAQLEKWTPKKGALAKSKVDQVSLECIHSKVPVELLRLLKGKDVLLGVIDVASDKVETAQEVSNVIKSALKYVPARHLFPCTNCGMAPMDRDIAVAKLKALVAGTALARKKRK
jgi:methionine synthase II (cobalamin-independent)